MPSSTLTTIARTTAAAVTETATATASPIMSPEDITKLLNRNHKLHSDNKNMSIAIAVFAVVFALCIGLSIFYCYMKIKTKTARMGVKGARKWFGRAQELRSNVREARGAREMV